MTSESNGNDAGVRDDLRQRMENRDVVGFINRSLAESLHRLPQLDDTSTRLILMILRVGGLIRYDHEIRLQRPLGLSEAGYHLMWIIWLTGPIEGSAAAFLMDVTRANVSGIASTLERDGMIVRVPSVSDGRASLLSLTEKGLKRCEEISLKIGESGHRFTSTLDAEETTTLIRLLGKVASIVASTLPKRT
jgi:DNA-binding MarR family transcriptional regulator